MPSVDAISVDAIYMCINTTLRKIQVPFQLSCRLMFAGIKNDHVLVGDD